MSEGDIFSKKKAEEFERTREESESVRSQAGLLDSSIHSSENETGIYQGLQCPSDSSCTKGAPVTLYGNTSGTPVIPPHTLLFHLPLTCRFANR